MVVSGNKFVTSNCEKYIVLWAGRVGWAIYVFSLLFTQYKVAKGQIFTASLQKDKLNPGK